MRLAKKNEEKQKYKDQLRAVNAVFDLLATDNARADRKYRDEVYAIDHAVVVISWGVEAEEAIRKHTLAFEMLAKIGLKIEDRGAINIAKEVIGGVEGVLIISERENGGFAAIAQKVLQKMSSSSQ